MRTKNLLIVYTVNLTLTPTNKIQGHLPSLFAHQLNKLEQPPLCINVPKDQVRIISLLHFLEKFLVSSHLVLIMVTNITIRTRSSHKADHISN